MMEKAPPQTNDAVKRIVAIVGGGFAGTLLALKLAAKPSDVVPVLIERSPRAGHGLAYGRAGPGHLLNVPAGHMEIGLEPTFIDWLAGYPAEIADAVLQAGDINYAFIPRALFGAYLEAQFEVGLKAETVRRIRGEVSRIQNLENGVYRLTLVDGRQIEASEVVLATGNLPPKTLNIKGSDHTDLADSAAYAGDPWSQEALVGLDADASVLLIGTGLTMADMVISLQRNGHRGIIHALSRHGLMPLLHAAGGGWATFLDGRPLSPVYLLRVVKQQARTAIALGIPWQRVLDAVRPMVAQIWSGWTRAHRGQFLRHLRPYWDVHRHRITSREGQWLQKLSESGRLIVHGGRLVDFSPSGPGLAIDYIPRYDKGRKALRVARIINCTGPCTDYNTTGIPLFSDLHQQGLIYPDPYGLGIETKDCHVIDARGLKSEQLFAIGALTRPALWEITAVPEINAQVTRLADRLSTRHRPQSATMPSRALTHTFADVGAGI